MVVLDELLPDTGERAGIRLTESDRAMLRQIAAHWYPGEQRKQSQTVRRLIREAYAQLAPPAPQERQEPQAQKPTKNAPPPEVGG